MSVTRGRCCMASRSIRGALRRWRKRIGLSRSALGERFSALIGVPPMQYLTRWRMSLAAAQLRESDVPIIRVATQVGYESEAAFNRAFKRELGLPPAAWRKRSRLQPAP